MIGYPDEEWGEKVMALIVMKPEAMVTAEDVQEYCHRRVASFKKPEIIKFVDKLPRNTLGKVLKKELKAEYASRA